MSITATPGERAVGIYVGTLRQMMNLGRKDTYGFVGDGFGIHTDGALAEMMVARSENVYWEPIRSKPQGHRDDSPPDVGGLWDVRHTALPNGCLVLHREDIARRVFVLVTGQAPTFEIRGWMVAKNGQVPEFWREENIRHPAFMIPQKRLNPMLTIPHRLDNP